MRVCVLQFELKKGTVVSSMQVKDEETFRFSMFNLSIRPA